MYTSVTKSWVGLRLFTGHDFTSRPEIYFQENFFFKIIFSILLQIFQIYCCRLTKKPPFRVRYIQS